jgi:hypothetical protein
VAPNATVKIKLSLMRGPTMFRSTNI